MKRTTTAKTLAIAAITVLALGIAPLARADNKGCTNQTLKGTFVHTASGFETAPPAIAGPLVGVGTDTFDGKGCHDHCNYQPKWQHSPADRNGHIQSEF